MLQSIFVFALIAGSSVAAGQHAKGSFRNPKRHHHRLSQRASPGGSCQEGQWQCNGTQLQQCVSSSWSTVRDCTGENMVCSAEADNTGCIWSWDAPSGSDPTSSTASPAGDASPSTSSGAGYDQPITTGAPGWYSRPTDDWQNPSSTASSSVSDSTPIDSTSKSSAQDDNASSTSKTQDWETASASVSASTGPDAGQNSSMTSTTKSSAPVPTSGGGSSGNWHAPHYVIYSDSWLHQMPDASDLTNFNRFILAFWMSERGAVDNAQMWEWMDAGSRQKVLNSYHAAGIALMVSAFGSTDSPVSSGVDPVDCAQKLASWVKQYNLDGVDIDWEDMNAMNTGIGEAWLITFQGELRRQLPAGQYLISHAPVAPWFTSGNNYPNGAYVAVHKQTGEGIDFYNMQFYNQGNGVYEDCQSLIFDSGSNWPSTSVMEMNSYAGIPLNKIVIGKPINAGAAANGYMDPASLNKCVSQAEKQGWNGGVMYWEWNSDTPGIIANTLAGIGL